jgi:hypothetical protein
MKIRDLTVEELKECYNDPNLQEAIAQFIGLVKKFDKTEDEKYLDDLTEVARQTVPKLPFDEVLMDDEWSKNPNVIMMVIGSHMIEYGILPAYN